MKQLEGWQTKFLEKGLRKEKPWNFLYLYKSTLNCSDIKGLVEGCVNWLGHPWLKKIYIYPSNFVPYVGRFPYTGELNFATGQ
jgi:hypothetical protein